MERSSVCPLEVNDEKSEVIDSSRNGPQTLGTGWSLCYVVLSQHTELSPLDLAQIVSMPPYCTQWKT